MVSILILSERYRLGPDHLNFEHDRAVIEWAIRLLQELEENVDGLLLPNARGSSICKQYGERP
jgi:hypothetical protein